IVEEPHHLSELLLERVPSYTTTPVAEDALITLPTSDEVAAAQRDTHLAKKSKGPLQARTRFTLVIISEPSQPSKKRRLKKRASEASSSALELGQAEGLNEADITDFCLKKVVSFEVVSRDLNIVPTITLFRVFECLCKQGDWFSFSKRQNTEDVCMNDGPLSLKKWKSKFFLIDRRAILDHLTWRHSHSCVSDDLRADGFDQNDVEQLRIHLIHLREMREEVLVHISIYDFITLPSWSDAKIVEEPHHLSELLLERVPSYTTTPVAEDACSLAVYLCF
nr:hypothetical protein [Tanacetum cinerariifolium]